MPELNRHHPRRLSAEAYAEANRVVFVTLCAKRRRAAFLGPQASEAVCRVLYDACAAEALTLIAYCIMPDHVHVVVGTNPGSSVPAFASRFKNRVTNALHEQGVPGEIWERSYWDRHARAEDDVRGMVDYVLANPVRAGLCDRPEEWPYSAFVGFPG